MKTPNDKWLEEHPDYHTMQGLAILLTAMLGCIVGFMGYLLYVRFFR